ncbi:MFS transporter [Amorphus sp. 3PC139-8]|uniref:MFS transporter n=1 Tax=Amorphus sp. 3PC139-8 TaxID=2735676 RepID=UPI00345DE27E
MAQANRWLILAAMTGSLSMVLTDQTVVAVALPTITDDLHLDASGQTWIVNAYLLAMAAFVAIGGRLGDKLGGVTLFRFGVLVFFLASAACGFAPENAWGEAWMIGFRGVQGIGAALMMPVTGAIVLSVFDKSLAGRAMAVYSGIGQIFLALGPLLGGFLTEFVSWRAVFWLNVPLGVLALVLVSIARPPNFGDRAVPISVRNACLLVIGIAGVILALQQGSVWGWTSPATLCSGAIGAACVAAFVVLSLRFHPPLIDLRMLTQRAFSADLFVAFILRFTILPISLYFAMYLQDILKMGATRAGIAMLPMVAAQVVGSQIGGWTYDRYGVRVPTLLGMMLATASLFYLAFALTELQYGLLVPALVCVGFAFGITISGPGTDALEQEPNEKRNQASGLLLTARQLGGTLGVALVGAVVLGVDPLATRDPVPQAGAEAVAAGVGFVAAVFFIALVVAAIFLPHEKGSPRRKKAGADG